MSRQARENSEYLHLIVRGVGKQILFEDDSDYEKYLSLLDKYAKETGIIILAYCLMGNHVHLLVRDTEAAVSMFMKRLGVSYAQYFNRKYERTGHVFQDRYKSDCVANDAYLLSVFRYILNNPQNAGICSAQKYPWSSYHEYGKKNCLTDSELLCGMIGSEESFQEFMRQVDETEHMEAETRKRDDAWALETLKKTLDITSGTQIKAWDRSLRNSALALLKEKGITVRQLERLTGINRGVIQKAKGVNENRPR